MVAAASLVKEAAGLNKAGAVDSDKLAAAFSGLRVDTPAAPLVYRAQDHPSTLGAVVGRTGAKDGTGVMSSFVYVDAATL